MTRLNTSYRTTWKLCAGSFCLVCHPTIALRERDARLIQIAESDLIFGAKRVACPRKHSRRKPYLRPLQRFLASHIGMPFDDVFSEVAKIADPRSAAGWSLCANVPALVTQDRFLIENGLERGQLRGFYVDQDTGPLASATGSHQ